MEERLSPSLAQNKQALKEQFGGTVDLYLKDVQLCGIPCCICMFEGLPSIERLWIMMLDSLSKAERGRLICAAPLPPCLFLYLPLGSAHTAKSILPA